MELLRALAALAEPPDPGTNRVARTLGLETDLDPADHTELFTFQLPPWASIYLGPEGMLGGEARDRIAGFWRAMGASPPAEPDHLTVLLAAYASLVEGEAEAAPDDRAAWRRLRHAFFWEHVASWIFPYLRRVDELAAGPYRHWGSLLADVLCAEADTLGPPARLPLHLRAAGPPPDQVDGAAVLEAVLVPARSGIILTRADLARAAQAVGLGLRMGERRYILQGFLDQAPEATAAWLADEAARQSRLHASAEAIPLITEHWRDRARATAGRLAGTGSSAPPLKEATHA
jgi:TorA maturation chaperone TorD